jgi:hypothetical protein
MLQEQDKNTLENKNNMELDKTIKENEYDTTEKGVFTPSATRCITTLMRIRKVNQYNVVNTIHLKR